MVATKVDKEMYKEKAKQAWATLRMEIECFLEENEQRVRGFFINHLKKRRNVGALCTIQWIPFLTLDFTPMNN